MSEAEDEAEAFVEIGAWLLPEAYGNDYDHFTETKAGTVPGHTIALYARSSDLASASTFTRRPAPPAR